jgi:hypothetical protein
VRFGWTIQGRACEAVMADKLDPEKARSDFLIAMYNQLMNDINRHIVVVWQSVTALLGAFAAIQQNEA